MRLSQGSVCLACMKYWGRGVLIHTTTLTRHRHNINPSIQRAEAGRFLQVQGQSGLYSKFQASQSYIVRFCFKTHLNKLTSRGGLCLYSQYLGYKGRRIRSSKSSSALGPAWVTCDCVSTKRIIESSNFKRRLRTGRDREQLAWEDLNRGGRERK